MIICVEGYTSRTHWNTDDPGFGHAPTCFNHQCQHIKCQMSVWRGMVSMVDRYDQQYVHDMNTLVLKMFGDSP